MANEVGIVATNSLILCCSGPQVPSRLVCSPVFCMEWSSSRATELSTGEHSKCRLVTTKSKLPFTSAMPHFRFVPRHADELYLEADDPVLMLSQSEDLWCQGYNMRTGASGIFPAFYAVKVPKDMNQGEL